MARLDPDKMAPFNKNFLDMSGNQMDMFKWYGVTVPEHLVYDLALWHSFESYISGDLCPVPVFT